MKKMEKALVAIVLAATVFMTGITALTSAQERSNQNNSNKMNSNMDSQMNSNSGSMMMSMADNNMLDAEFAMMAAKGSEAEIQMANLALSRSQNSEVQKFARMMIKDHSKAGKKLEKTAMKKNMTLDKSLTAEQQEMLSKLQQATAADFDMMYIQMGGVMAHEKMEAMFQNQIRNGTDAQIKDFAGDVLPTVQKHLKMARAMNSGGMSMSGDSMNGNMKMKDNMNSNRRDSSNSNMNGNMNSNRGNSNSNDNR